MDDTTMTPHPGSRLGSLYPLHSIVAHIDDAARAAAAEAALLAAGWRDVDLRRRSGEEVVREAAAFECGRTLFQRLAALFPSEETVIEKEFKEAAARGAWMLFVRAETGDRRATARRILRGQHACGLRYYDDRVIVSL